MGELWYWTQVALLWFCVSAATLYFTFKYLT